VNENIAYVWMTVLGAHTQMNESFAYVQINGYIAIQTNQLAISQIYDHCHFRLWLMHNSHISPFLLESHVLISRDATAQYNIHFLCSIEGNWIY
jgi:hypothetical protein